MKANPAQKHGDKLLVSMAERLLKNPDITHAKMFGFPGLKISRKMFVTFVKGELIIKLPKERVNALVASKQGKPFYHLFDNSRIMKEWVAIRQKNKEDWLKLTQEAKNFVASIQKM